jgi:hypothetical protein
VQCVFGNAWAGGDITVTGTDQDNAATTETIADTPGATVAGVRTRVVVGMSGGVDSSVAAALVHRAIGDQLTCVYVDHGLLRQNEATQVMESLGRNLGVKIIHVDASEKFLSDLAGVSDPEAKRKIIGREFVEVFQAEAKKLPRARWLSQGTIYPDVIESAGGKTKKATTIKSHHNVGGLPETLNLKLLEPLRELFKDEVRELGLALGLPRELGMRAFVFSDFGTLWETDAKGANVVDDPSLRASMGVGLSWRSPFGPLRISLAAPVKREKYDRDEIIRINFGTRF